MNESQEQYDAMVKMNALHRQKVALCQRKAEIQAALSAFTAEVRGKRVQAGRYEHVCREQVGLKNELAGIERQLGELVQNIRDLSIESKVPAKDAGTGRSVIPVLVGLRDEYEAFAADATRVSSMRRMAAEFGMKLTRIIREL